MKIDVALDPALRELLVKILAPGETEELAALLARLEEPLRLTGFREGGAVPLDPAEVLRFYGEDKEVRAQTLKGEIYTVRLRLYELEERTRAAELDALRGERMDNSFGSQIRNYVLYPYQMVKDLRSGVETGNVDAVLGGDLEDFVIGYHKWHASQ